MNKVAFFLMLLLVRETLAGILAIRGRHAIWRSGSFPRGADGWTCDEFCNTNVKIRKKYSCVGGSFIKLTGWPRTHVSLAGFGFTSHESISLPLPTPLYIELKMKSSIKNITLEEV